MRSRASRGCTRSRRPSCATAFPPCRAAPPRSSTSSRRTIVARSIRAILDDGIANGFDGQEYWITSGSRSAPTGRLIEILAEAGERHGLRLEVPRFIPSEAIDRLIRAAFYELFPAVARKRMDELVAMSALFFESETFPSSLGFIPGGPPAPSAAEVEAAIVASLEHLIRAKGIGAPRAATA